MSFKRIASFIKKTPDRVMRFIPHFRIFTSWAKPGCQILAYITVLVAMIEMNIDILRHEIPDYLEKRSSLIGYAYPSSIYFAISFIVMIQWAILAIRTCFTLLKGTPSATVLTIFVLCKIVVVIICSVDIIIIFVQYSTRKNRQILALGLCWTSLKIVLCMVSMVALATLHQLLVRKSNQCKENIKEEQLQTSDSQLFIYIPLHAERSPSHISKALTKSSYISAIGQIIHDNIGLSPK